MVVTKLPPLLLLKWGSVSGEGDTGKAAQANTRCLDALGLYEGELDVRRRRQTWALGGNGDTFLSLLSKNIWR